MKYCSQCGKKLEPGKTCDCREKRKEKKIIENNNIIIDFLKKPFDTLDEYSKGSHTNQSWLLISAISMLFGFFFTEMSYRMQPRFLLISYPYFRNFIIYSILIIASILFFNILIQCFTKVIMKKEISFYQLLDIVAISLLPFLYTLLLAIIVSFLLGCFSYLILVIGLIFASVIYLYQIKKQSDLNSNQFIYLFLGSLMIIGILWL